MNIDPLIVVVEDDPAIRRVLKTILTEAGYELEFATTLEGGLSLISSLKPDLILLDLGLPDGDGIRLIQEFSTPAHPPIVVLSARGSEAEKVRALDEGARDYVTKPFGPAELRARVGAALRSVRPVTTKGSLVFEELTVDQDARRVYLGTKEVHLSPLEYKLLLIMAWNAGKILTTRYLLKEVWGREDEEQRHYVRVLTAGLRKKIEADSSAARFIHTESGVGYRFYN